MAKAKMVKKINESEPILSKADLFASFERAKQMAIQEVIVRLDPFF